MSARVGVPLASLTASGRCAKFVSIFGVDTLGGGGGEEGAESPAPPPPVASLAPTATATPTAAVPSGVQAIIDAALSGDPEQLEPLVGYTKVGCITTPPGIGQPPLCRDGEAGGTPVAVLPVG